MITDIDSLRLIKDSAAEAGCVVVATHQGWGGIFSKALVINGGIYFDGKALLPLDGNFACRFFRIEEGKMIRKFPLKSLRFEVSETAGAIAASNVGSLIATPDGPWLVTGNAAAAGVDKLGKFYLNLSSFTLEHLLPTLATEVLPQWRLLAVPLFGEELELVSLATWPAH